MCQWHDYHLTGYRVDGECRTLTLSLAWLYEGVAPRPRVHLVFSGVEGYLFEHDLGIGVVACIGEEDLPAFLGRQEPAFQQSERWGWPTFWRGSAEATAASLQAVGARPYFLDSALGMTGWVVAQRLDHHETRAGCC